MNRITNMLQQMAQSMRTRVEHLRGLAVASLYRMLPASLAHRLAPDGSTNTSILIWIGIGAAVAIGGGLWLTAGGGYHAITNMLNGVSNGIDTHAPTY